MKNCNTIFRWRIRSMLCRTSHCLHLRSCSPAIPDKEGWCCVTLTSTQTVFVQVQTPIQRIQSNTRHCLLTLSHCFTAMLQLTLESRITTQIRTGAATLLWPPRVSVLNRQHSGIYRSQLIQLPLLSRIII